MAIDQELLAKVKAAIRISHDKLDDDVADNIQASLDDLKMHGVIYANETDPLIQNAVKLFCKAEYTDEPAKAEAYRLRYKELRDCLKVAGGYGWKDEVVADE